MIAKNLRIATALMLFVMAGLWAWASGAAAADVPESGAPAYKVPDYKAIEAAVKADLPAYQALLQRFAAADTTMTDDEIHFLYYGFPYAGSYNPYYIDNELDAALAAEDTAEADSLCAEALKPCQVSLKALFYPLKIHKKFAGPDQQKKLEEDVWRINSIANAIFLSGESDASHPLYVLFVSDEYAILDIAGLWRPVRQYVTDGLDVLVVPLPNCDGGATIDICFNIDPSREYLNRMLAPK